MKKTDLIRKAKLVLVAAIKMGKGKIVNIEVLYKITKVLDIIVGEILTFI